jgi:uncharacterized protein (DUF362 family)
MKRKGLTRRDFLKAGVGAAAGMMTASLLGCSGGSDGVPAATTPGYQSKQPWSFQGQQGVTAIYKPVNSSLYRDLLPSEFQMPDAPALVLAFVSYPNVTSPLLPYREFYAMLTCKYQGQTGLYTLTMPVTDKAACDGGVAIGFPKYVADQIELISSGAGWTGVVVHKGRRVAQLSFTASGEESTVKKYNPGPSYMNLLPPSTGTQVTTVNIKGWQTVSTTAGSATVVVDQSERWSKLLDGATPVYARFEEMTGDWQYVTGLEINSAVVSIARIKNGRTDLAVEEAIRLLGGIDAVTAGKQKIMLKPNLVTESAGCTTKPEVVGALARMMLGAGKEVSIGEGSGACTNYNIVNGVLYRTKNRTRLDGMQQYIFDTLGYTSLSKTLGIPLVNLHSGSMTSVPIPNGFVFDSISIHSSLTEIDMLCSVPVMKTHILGGVTLGMKNLIGTFPGTVYGSARSLVHDEAVKKENSAVAGTVVDIVRANKLGLVVIDASTAMEGNGPTDGTLVPMNLIIAGTNPLATDMVAANIMGFAPTEIRTFQWANRAGMVPVGLEGIEVRGESIASVQRRFKKPDIVPWSSIRSSFGAQEI